MKVVESFLSFKKNNKGLIYFTKGERTLRKPLLLSEIINAVSLL